LAERVATTAILLLIAGSGVFLITLNRTLWWAAGGVLTVVGTWGAFRALSVAVVLDADRLIVRGFFRTRTVPRSSTASASRFPTLDLKTSDGGGVEIALSPFVGGDSEGPGMRRKLDAKQAVERWLDPE
jgi:hypothetical protein